MAKSSGLGDGLLVAGRDLSGDVQSLGKVGGGPALLDLTPISKYAHERIAALLSGEISFATFFNDATAQEHATLKGLPTTDIILMYLRGSTAGGVGAGIVGKQINYDFNRGADGMLTAAVQALSNGSPLEFGRQVTAGLRTDTGATAGTGVNDWDSLPATKVVTGGSAANPTVVTVASHGLVTGDSVDISGTDKAALNASHTVTVVNANTFTVPVDLSGGAASAGVMQKTSSNYGWAAYLVVTSFTGTDATIKLRDSSDDTTYADLSGGTFVAVTAAPYVERLASASATATVRKWLRATTSTTGGFSSMSFAVLLIRHEVTRPT